MSRLIPQAEMSAHQLLDCGSDAIALLALAREAAWAIQNDATNTADVSDALGRVLKLAQEMIAPMQDALERHEGLKGGIV